MSHLLFVNFPVVCLQHDKLTVVYLLFSKFNSSQMLEFDVVEAWYSLEQYIGLKEDKLSSTTVDFIRSEGNLETKCLYWFSKPKMC